MEPVISTSFIPKRPVSTEPVVSTHRATSVGLLSFITFIIVIGTAIAYGGVYAYQQSLQAQETKLQASMVQAQAGLGTSFVSDMQRLSARISAVKTLVQNHVVVSPIFSALQATTLQSVQYKDFTYQFSTDPTTNAQMVQVQITGTALSYATLALQSDAYEQAPIIKNPIFSDLIVDPKTQQLGFKLVFDVTPSDLSYPTFINNLAAASAAVPAATTDTTPAAPVPAAAPVSTLPDSTAGTSVTTTSQ